MCGNRHFTLFGWHWFLPGPEPLLSWMDDPASLEEHPLKRNSGRCVFQARDTRGNLYYVKHDIPHGFFGRFKALFRSKVKREYKSACLLRKSGIPCVDYLGWGTRFPEGMLISRAQRNSVSALEYWFTSAIRDPDRKVAFLNELASITRRFMEARLLHRDFHPGNLLCDCDTGRLVVVDPYGITHGGRLAVRDRKLRLLRICIDFRGELSRAEICDFCFKAGLSESPDEARTLWQITLDSAGETILRQWPRRQRQILAGTSKFAVMNEENNGGRLFVRNSEWFAPRTIDLSALEAVSIDHVQARQLWLDSFLAAMLRQRIDRVPQAWHIPADSTQPDTLYYYRA